MNQIDIAQECRCFRASIVRFEVANQAARARRKIAEQGANIMLVADKRRLAAQRRSARRLEQDRLGPHRAEQSSRISRRHARRANRAAQVRQRSLGLVRHFASAFDVSEPPAGRD
jgi:hypothetical protein